MHTRIREILENRHGNYILPFFWQHGEDEATLRQEMQQIEAAGIKAVCVEARPHPDFCGEGWWRDMDIILDEARQRDMKVWVLDDAHFPTGFANGWIRDKYPEHKKIYLNEEHMDVRGPQKGASLLVANWLGAGDKLLAVVAARQMNENGEPDTTLLNLTPKIVGDHLYWDIPEGYWRVFFIIETPNGGGNPDYINPVDPDSCRVLIEAVYEKHFEKYKDDFGKTLAGFFSDEPLIGNVKGMAFDAALGKRQMVLPWSKPLLGRLNAAFNNNNDDDAVCCLPGLWHDIGAATWPIRYAYMNVVSQLYSECFSLQIGDWCRDHGVEYIGHIIEDQDAHARLGSSCAHFFRSMQGQDMSGIDVVLCTIRPGFDRQLFTKAGAKIPADGEFYHYELAKLGASHAHIDPRKKGRAMCEIYGAYGWTEGLKLMKWLTDHMLVRGINWLVPHAFSPKEFPDNDCPPHFYAHGMNPQYKYFRILMDYANRLCHFLNDGRHVASAAVLYHAEAEWSGACMSVKEPMRVLMQAQLDADIVPADVLCEAAAVEDGRLLINRERFGCLIVPWAERLPRAVLGFIEHALARGLKIVFVQDWPGACSEGTECRPMLDAIRENINAHLAGLAELPGVLTAFGLRDIEVAGDEPYLRSYHYRHDDNLDVYMFFNEAPEKPIDTTVKIPGAERFVRYDAFANQVLPVAARKCHDEQSAVDIKLAAYESLILLAGDVPEMTAPREPAKESIRPLVCAEWQLSIAAAGNDAEFTPCKTVTDLINLHQPQELPDFSGTIRYETTFAITADAGQPRALDLGEVYETAEVWINGEHAGVKICPPYTIDITGLVKPGENRLRIEVTNTLVYKLKDQLSKFMPQEPVGLLGPLQLHCSSDPGSAPQNMEQA